MANCTNCSAPLPPHSIKCEYCGSRNDVDLKGVHYFTTHELDSERSCPRCSVRLKTIDLKLEGRFLIERCDTCLGLFFDPGELEAVLDGTVTKVFTINPSQLASIGTIKRASEYGVSYVKCPVCTKIMNRMNFGAKSGVIVDRCKEHGVWLDGGELRQLCEWMKAGGKLLDQQRQGERKNEEAARENDRRQAPTQFGALEGNSDFGEFGGMRESDPDLMDIVWKAVRFFTR